MYVYTLKDGQGLFKYIKQYKMAFYKTVIIYLNIFKINFDLAVETQIFPAEFYTVRAALLSSGNYAIGMHCSINATNRIAVFDPDGVKISINLNNLF